MTLKISIALLYTMIFLSPAISSESEAECPRNSTTFIGSLFKPVTFVLNVFCKPLCYFSSSSESSASELKFQEALLILNERELDDTNLFKASLLLEESAVDGNSSALYHLGRLMMEFPEDTLVPLQKLVRPDHVMAMHYLDAAVRKGKAEALEVMKEYKGIKLLNHAVALAYGLDGQTPKYSKARAILHRAIMNKSPHAICFVAECILHRGHDWVLSEHKDMYENRVAAIPMLEYAASRYVPKARELLAELALEDLVYEEICQMILMQAGEAMDGLKLGDAGYQERFIDMLCEKEFKIRGYTMSPTRGLFLKQTMLMRTNQLYHFLSRYAQYIGAKNKLLTSSQDVDATLALKLMVDYVVGKKEITIPKVDESDMEGPHVFDFTIYGLTCGVTPLDSNTAYRKMVFLDEDFMG